MNNGKTWPGRSAMAYDQNVVELFSYFFMVRMKVHVPQIYEMPLKSSVWKMTAAGSMNFILGLLRWLCETAVHFIRQAD